MTGSVPQVVVPLRVQIRRLFFWLAGVGLTPMLLIGGARIVLRATRHGEALSLLIFAELVIWTMFALLALAVAVAIRRLMAYQPTTPLLEAIRGLVLSGLVIAILLACFYGFLASAFVIDRP